MKGTPTGKPTSEHFQAVVVSLGNPAWAIPKACRGPTFPFPWPKSVSFVYWEQHLLRLSTYICMCIYIYMYIYIVYPNIKQKEPQNSAHVPRKDPSTLEGRTFFIEVSGSIGFKCKSAGCLDPGVARPGVVLIFPRSLSTAVSELSVVSAWSSEGVTKLSLARLAST